jgi:hypothetical protein
MNNFFLILVFINCFVFKAHSQFYTSLGSGILFHSIHNKEDSKTTDFVLHQKAYRSTKTKFSVPIQLQFGFLFSKHLGIELSPNFCSTISSRWSYGKDNKNCNRDIGLYNYLFPLSINYHKDLSKKISCKFIVGGFLNYVPKYYFLTDYSNLNNNVPDRSFFEIFKTLDGYLILGSDLGQQVEINYKLNQPLITKFQFGYTGAFQFGYDFSPSLNLFIQIQAFKTISDLENKKDIIMIRTFENGMQDEIKINYYSNMYKQFYDRAPNDLNNRPKSTLTILNCLFGIKYIFREKKDDTFRIQ